MLLDTFYIILRFDIYGTTPYLDIFMQLDKCSSCERDSLTSIYGKNTCSLAPHQLSFLFVWNANVSMSVRGCKRHEVKKVFNTSFMTLLQEINVLQQLKFTFLTWHVASKDNVITL